MDRRTYMQVAAGGGLSIVAGCLSGADDDEDELSENGPSDEPADGGADSPSDTVVPAIDDHPVDEPVLFARSHQCPICGMGPADYAGWACQLAHADGTGVFFESPGCLLAYVVVPRDHPTEA